MTAQHKIWMDGRLVSWEQATVHVTAHALHYGSSVFEGIRAYSTPTGPALFCLERHVQRLFHSAKVCRMEIPFTPAEIEAAIIDTIAANGHRACYVRPLAYRDAHSLAVNPNGCPVRVAIVTMEWGSYLGAEALEQGVDVGVSSWTRMAPNTFPAAVKVGGQYVNSQFIAMEAERHGYAEGIALDTFGFVSEGSGENVFLVTGGRIVTPPAASSILQGITRGCVMRLAADLGYEVREEQVPRELLYLADEAFFTGTAAEITPIRSVDGIAVGAGCRGPITGCLQAEFLGIASGRLPDRHRWLTPCRR
jgi:branched-chain amino acid aminotransferase